MKRSKYDALKLENQLCFPLYACSREVIKLYKPCLDEIDLTYTQYITMMVLWERRCVSVKELGMCLHLDSGTLTPLLKKLEAKGMLNRKRSEEDERSLLVTLTEAGEKLRDRAVDIPAKMAQSCCLNAEETQTLYGLLYKLLASTVQDQDQE